ncbi:MAG: hypothetical protein WBL21_06345 [Salinimicrobium sp.]
MSDPKQTIITMKVDVKNLNENNVEKHVHFSDDHGARQNGSPKNFTSIVKKNQKIIWKGSVGETDVESDKVEITKITRKKIDGGEKLLKSTKFEDGTVVGKIKDEDLTGIENYEVHFSINGNGYVVDPKLEIKTPDQI